MTRRARSVQIFRWGRDGQNADPFFNQFANFFSARTAFDGAWRGLAVMDAAGFVRKGGAHFFRIGCQSAELGNDSCRDGFACFLGRLWCWPPDGWRSRAFDNTGAVAVRAAQLPTFLLLRKGLCRGKPTLEAMTLRTDQIKDNHECGATRGCSGSTILTLSAS